MSEVNEGVQIIVNRMESNPEEFFGDGGKWNWIFKDKFREVMNEQEKAAIFEGLKQVRRKELTTLAVAAVLPEKEEDENIYKSPWYTTTPVKAGGSSLTFANANTNTNSSLTIGTETLDTDTIRRLKGLLV